MAGELCKPERETVPPNVPGHPGSTATSQTAQAVDPNELLGPGYGDEGWVQADQVLPYRINFENDKTATAPAQRVDIVNKLDTMLDWCTFRLTSFGFGDMIITVPQEASPFYYEHTLRMETINGMLIDVQFFAGLDMETGTLYISFQSLDPTTSLPPGILDGFLPPEDETGRGMGFVTYTIRPKSNLQTGDSFTNVASIRFDFGETIDTNQVDPHDPSQGTDPTKEARVTIDTVTPTSRVTAFAATEVASPFTVSWSGNDVGSGVASYDIYVSIDGGAFVKWLNRTTETSAIYTGEVGKTYSFYSIAYDNVGLAENAKTSAEGTVQVTSNNILTPVNLRAVQTTQTAISLQWNTVAGATEYVLQRKGPGESDFVTIYTGTAAKFIDQQNLTASTTYQYRVQAVGSNFTQPISVTTTSSTAMTSPIVLETKTENGQTKLTWTDLGNEYTYTVFKAGRIVASFDSKAYYVDDAMPTSGIEGYAIMAYNRDLKQYSSLVTTVAWTSAPPLEITGHEKLPDGGIKLQWDAEPGLRYSVFRAGMNVSGASYITTGEWIDRSPQSGNDYMLVAVYQNGTSWNATFSNLYTVSGTQPAGKNTLNTLLGESKVDMTMATLDTATFPLEIAQHEALLSSGMNLLQDSEPEVLYSVWQKGATMFSNVSADEWIDETPQSGNDDLSVLALYHVGTLSDTAFPGVHTVKRHAQPFALSESRLDDVSIESRGSPNVVQKQVHRIERRVP
jgi:hypothetical protein